MKRILLWTAVLTIMVTMTVWAVTGPKIKMNEEVHDFGTVNDTETLKYVFEIENVGDEMLAISKVQASCGCTSALLTYSNITPGAKGLMEIGFDPRGRQGDVVKAVTIYSNDPTAPQKVVQFRTIIISKNGMIQNLRSMGFKEGVTLTAQTLDQLSGYIVETVFKAQKRQNELTAAKMAAPGAPVALTQTAK